ncbi:MAG: hypothetical protein KY476_23955, partial [Planctomycetes bacterium]|nr:hypothetical protein [Planctomycetota bacterium]
LAVAATALPGAACRRAAVADEGVPPRAMNAGEDGPSRREAPAELRSRVVEVEKASSSRKLRAVAAAELPLAQLADAERRRAEALVAEAALFRQLPTVTFRTRPEVLRFFLEQPDVAVAVWKAMEISEFRLERTAADRFEARDEDGSTGTIEVLSKREGELLAICNGIYRGPLLPASIEARALFHLTTEFVQGEDGATTACCRLRLFVAFPSTTVETAARIISPVTNLIVDRNFGDIALWMHLMTEAMEERPGWVEHLTRALEDLAPERRTELRALSARVYRAARK